MAPPTLTRPVAAFDRLEILGDPDALSKVLGPLTRIDREPLHQIQSGYSDSRHELLHAIRDDGTRLVLRLKRTHLGEDWLARRSREVPPGREVSLLAEPALAGVWEAFVRAHVAFAVEGSEVGLLMEDHSSFVLPDVREPISVEAEDQLLGAIAALHARFWEAPALELPWLAKAEVYLDLLGPGQAKDETALRGAPDTIRERVPRGWREALRLLPGDLAARLTLPADQLWKEWSDLPCTLVHGDTKVANFALLPNGGVAAFDLTRVGAAPATLDLGWYVAVNSTRLARRKDDVIARYRELLEAGLRRPLEDSLWERMLDAGLVTGARTLLWSKALGLHEGTAFRREDWSWWVDGLIRWSRR